VIASRTPNPLCHQAASKLHLPRINLRWVRSFVEQLHLQQALAKTCMHTGSAASHSAPTTSSDNSKRSHMQCRLAEPDQPCRCRFSVQRWFIVGVREKNDRPPESESDHQQSCPCTPCNPPHLAAAAPASLPTQAQLDKIPSVEIEVRPTALPSLLTLTLTPDLNFQSLASEGRDPYAGRTEGHGSVGSKVIVETDGRTRLISLPYLPR